MISDTDFDGDVRRFFTVACGGVSGGQGPDRWRFWFDFPDWCLCVPNTKFANTTMRWFSDACSWLCLVIMFLVLCLFSAPS
jgi:hypothetical protein